MTILGLFLNNELRTGGHRRYLELLESLAARGHELRVLLNEELDWKAAGCEELRLPVAYRRGQNYPVSLVFRAALKKAWPSLVERIGRPDFILVHGETNLAAARFLAAKTGARILFGHRSNAVRESLISLAENRRRPRLFLRALRDYLVYRRYEGRMAREADVLVFQSAYDRDDVGSRAPGVLAKARVIPGNIAEPRFRSADEGRNRRAGLARLLFVGTLGERKGIRYLLEALAILAEGGRRDLFLDVLGPGEALSELEAYLEARGLREAVRFHGRVSNPFDFYAEADLMIVPSLFDSYPDTVLESFHLGVPVIGSAVGGIPEMLGREDLLFPPRDAKAIADLIERAAKDRAWLQEIRAYCFERRRTFHFDWAERWEAAMLAALASGEGR